MPPGLHGLLTARDVVPLASLPPRVRDVVAWRREKGLFDLGSDIMTYGRPPQERLPSCVQGLKLQDCLVKVPDGPFRITSLPESEIALARLVLGMLFLAAGGLDEAHAVAQIAMRSESHYLHAMLHRQEGGALGEAGLTGWGNARYWFGVLDHHDLFDDPDRPASVLKCAQIAARGDTALEEWVAGLKAGWNADAFVQLCEAAVSGDHPSGVRAEEFCRKVITAEWELVFALICQEADFSSSSDNS